MNSKTQTPATQKAEEIQRLEQHRSDIAFLKYHLYHIVPELISVLKDEFRREDELSTLRTEYKVHNADFYKKHFNLDTNFEHISLMSNDLKRVVRNLVRNVPPHVKH